MKKLKLNKLFHWLYAFLMLYPILCFFGTLLVMAFNNTFSLNGASITDITSGLWEVIESTVFVFDSGSVGVQLHDVFGFVVYRILGPELTDVSDMVVSLLTYWTSISLMYLVFDVVMLPINIAHHWIDKGSDRL